jgi:lipopolysaccharide export system protein LptC
MSTQAGRLVGHGGWAMVRAGWDRVSVYVPIILMGFIALGTYWLARNTPSFGTAESSRPPTHEPDSYMRRFSVKTFDPSGRLKSEIFGETARHFPDTDTLEIEQPRVRSFDERGDLTTGSARRALTNADGSEVQLFGDAVITREAGAEGSQERPAMELRGDFLDLFMNTERVTSNKPVELRRGSDRVSGDSMQYDNLSRVLVLTGHVHGVLAARQASPR